MLSSIADGEAQRLANAQAAKLRYGMNAILAREKVSWKVYGNYSDWKMYYGADAPPHDGDDQSVDDVPWQRLDARHPQQSLALRQALVLQGIDFNGGRALVGTCHTDDVIAETLAGFAAAVRTLNESGLA
jgi:glutamate-1-semialdehyde 2,1-aminomutase